MPRPEPDDRPPLVLDPAVMADIRAKLDAPIPCTDDGFTDDGSMPQPIWTPAGFLVRGDRFVLHCACGHSADAPLQRLVDAGQGDLPMHLFNGKWSCRACGGREMRFETVDGPRVSIDDELAGLAMDADSFAIEIPEHMRAPDEDEG